MKKYIIAYTCILALNIYAAEEQKQITIVNNSLETISINSYVQGLLSKKILARNAKEITLKYNEIRSFNIIDGTQTCKIVHQLSLPDTFVPQFINLNITEDGLIRPGHTLTISSVGSAGSQDLLINAPLCASGFMCKNCLNPIVIGSDPTLFPNNNITTQEITIHNKDLYRVSVFLSLYRQSFRDKAFGMHLPRPCKDNSLAESHRYALQETESKNIKIEHSQDQNIKQLLELKIPQAKQNVQININNGTINSGDTLQVSWSEEGKKILIHKLLPDSNKILLARLHSREKNNLTETFG